MDREYKADAYACGRVTMEGSFTGGWYPDLSTYVPARSPMDFLVDDLCGFYAVAFDPHGRLGWKSNTIIDEDPGYGGAMEKYMLEDVQYRGALWLNYKKSQ